MLFSIALVLVPASLILRILTKGLRTRLEVRQLGGRNRKKLSYSFLNLFGTRGMRNNTQLRSKSTVL